MGPKYEHFKFAIGDIVMLKQSKATSKFGHGMMVVERLYQECPGGVQLHYICRNEGFADPRRYLEIELVPFVEPDQEPAAWSNVVERMNKRASERAMRDAFDVANKEPEPPAE